MEMVIARLEVYLVTLDPTPRSEIRKKSPGLIISPDSMNHAINTVIIAPMTTKGSVYPTRVDCEFDGKSDHIVMDQLRTVGKTPWAHPTNGRSSGAGHSSAPFCPIIVSHFQEKPLTGA